MVIAGAPNDDWEVTKTHAPAHASVLALASALALVASLTACATPTDPGSAPPLVGDNPASAGDVVGQGTVIQVGDADPQFCLGGVMESHPPQCSGIGLDGWDWNSIEGHETANDVTWGAYAIWGSYDGETLTVTDSVMLALYDPMFIEDPATLPENAGDTAEADLIAIQDTLHADAPFEVLTSHPHNGYLFVTVVYDDGTYQEWVDNRYGPDIVQIRSALRDLE